MRSFGAQPHDFLIYILYLAHRSSNCCFSLLQRLKMRTDTGQTRNVCQRWMDGQLCDAFKLLIHNYANVHKMFTLMDGRIHNTFWPIYYSTFSSLFEYRDHIYWRHILITCLNKYSWMNKHWTWTVLIYNFAKCRVKLWMPHEMDVNTWRTKFSAEKMSLSTKLSRQINVWQTLFV